MTRFELVIAGGGLTAARAIKSYRDAGGGGRIALLARRALPYHRPALSKRYLRGDDRRARSPRTRRSTASTTSRSCSRRRSPRSIPARARSRPIAASSHYDKLLLATGATPRRLRVPGADLDGVFSLRTLQDSERIRAAAGAAERAVVVGGGFIGMEVAASLRQLGLDGDADPHGPGSLRPARLARAERAAARALPRARRRRPARAGGRRASAAATGSSTSRRQAACASRPTSPSSASVSSRTSTSSKGAASRSTTASSSTSASRRALRASTPPATSPTSSTRSIDAGAGSSTGRTPTTRAPRSARSSPVETAATTPSPRSSARSSAPRSRSSATPVTAFDELTTEGSLETGLLASYGDEGRLVGAISVGQSEEIGGARRRP